MLRWLHRDHGSPFGPRLLGDKGGYEESRSPTDGAPAQPPGTVPDRRDGELFRETFQTVSEGPYDPTDSPWGNFPLAVNHTANLCIQPRADGGNMLVTEYPAGPDGVGNGNGGGDFQVTIGEYDELYLAYEVRFRAGFEFVRGGKLPGLIGGRGQNTTVTGGADPTGQNGWSARMMWGGTDAEPPAGQLVQYVYYPEKANPEWGESMPWFEQPSWERDVVSDDQWYWIEHRVKMNDPGEPESTGRHNGLIQGWLNGRLAMDRRELRFRDTADWGIDRFYFSSFFGGGRGNPDYAHSRTERIDYDNFIVSTQPITHDP